MRPSFPAGHIGLVALTILASCSRAPSGPATANPKAMGPVTIYAVNYPLQYFAQRIGGRHVTVVCPVPPDIDPAFWMPSPQILTEYQAADLILLNGASYARWTSSVSLPPSKLLDTSAALRDRYIHVQEGLTHSHGPSGEHVHGGTAFTIWLDPQLAIAQAEAIHARLISLRPRYEDDFDQGLAALKQDLEEIDTKIMALAGQQRELPLVFSHPVYQYFARRYALNARSVHWEPNEMPADAMWDEFATLQERHPAKWMIWEDEPDAAIVARLREMNVESIVFRPCGNAPSAGDYLAVMQANIDNLAKVFGSENRPDSPR